MNNRYIRPEERIGLAIKKTRAGVRDSQRPTGTEKARTKEVAEAAAEDAGSALSQADAAAAKAAAATETALGFARYSQVDGGPIVPALPVDGPRQGAELVKIDEDGHPYEVDVWNGAAWVKSQYLMDQLLVLGEDGTVQIENGRIVAPEVIGGEVTGAVVRGGLVEQLGEYEQGSVFRWVVPENLAAWVEQTPPNNHQGGYGVRPIGGTVPPIPTGAFSTSLVYGSRTIVSSQFKNVSEIRSPAIIPATSPVKVSAWCISMDISQNIDIRWPDGFTQTITLPANTWTLLSRTCTSNALPLRFVEALHVYPTISTRFGVADVMYETFQKVVAGSSLEVVSGRPQLSFLTGPDDADLQRIGSVSPNGVDLPGVNVSDGGVIVQSNGVFASEGNTVLAGKSLSLISSGPINVSGRMNTADDIPWARAITSAGFGAAQLKNGWTNQINVNWDGLQTCRLMDISYITGAITKAAAFGSLEVVATLPPAMWPQVPTMVPAAYVTAGGYVLVRTNGDIVTSRAGSGGQIAIAGSLVAVR